METTVVLRHRRENLKKCSLRGLEGRRDFRFLTYPVDPIPELGGHVLLSLDAKELSDEDRGSGLFVLDGTWRYAGKMYDFITKQQVFRLRSLPGAWRTAYPRRQDDCVDPSRGLASIEAIFAAYHTLGYPTEGLLDSYYWKEQFVSLNRELLGGK